MKRLYSILTVIVALFVFASLAVAKPPFWNDQVNKPGRFKKLGQFSNAAVYGKETGLVWEQLAGDTDGDTDVDDNDRKTWFNALSHCYQRTVGGRKGWRLPTIEELASLVVDTSVAGNPRLPSGHPFSNVQLSRYWSATTDANDTSLAWTVFFNDGVVGTFVKTDDRFVWCVRGGQGIDGAGQGAGGTL